MNRVKTLVFIYNSFNDPLFQNLVLTYVKTLAKTEGREFHVITFEQEQYTILEEDKFRIKKELASQNIYWYPLKFHTGKFILFKKVIDLVQAIGLVLKLRFIKKTKVIFAFANIAASFSVLFAKLLKMKMVIFSYEPHSEFLEELGIWSQSSMKYKLLNSLENYAGGNADFVLTGTKFMVERLHKRGAKGEVFRAPTGVSESVFYPTNESRKLKEKYGLTGKKVLFYIGKFGDLYYTTEVPFLFEILKKEIPDLFFLVVTPTKLESVYELFDQEGVHKNDYMLIESKLTLEEVNRHIGVADIGLSAVPPTPSQKYRSPTKVGEYLMCGVPFITSKGVSEDDLYAKMHNVGVVLEEFNEENIVKAVDEIKMLLQESKKAQKERCRKVGVEYRSKQHVVDVLENVYSKLKTDIC